SACAAGGYFFRFAGKSNQKGATSLEEAIFFYTGTAVVTMEIVPFPATYLGGWGERLRTAAHRGEACRGVVPFGKTVAYRKLRWGANQTWRSTPAPRLRCVVRQAGACPVAASLAD
ncbi:MAG: hypothetical protein LBO63_08990, partial [Oscillospiraceae bacterium]|nr:hypothetical protein [Oscillospiraceae bacterium]